MRKLNAILTALILVLFLVHAILGGFQLLGLGNTISKTVARAAVGLIALHTVLGVKFTVDTLRVQKRTGVSYWKENKLFWARRVSGFAMMALLAFHVAAFGYDNAQGAYRLQRFDAFRLTTQLLLVAALAVHVITNVRPMLISFGIKSLKQWVGDILFVLSVLLLFMAAAFIVYYLRWNVL